MVRLNWRSIAAAAATTAIMALAVKIRPPVALWRAMAVEHREAMPAQAATPPAVRPHQQVGPVLAAHWPRAAPLQLARPVLPARVPRAELVRPVAAALLQVRQVLVARVLRAVSLFREAPAPRQERRAQPSRAPHMDQRAMQQRAVGIQALPALPRPLGPPEQPLQHLPQSTALRLARAVFHATPPATEP